jgi:hypothetical protein
VTRPGGWRYAGKLTVGVLDSGTGIRWAMEEEGVKFRGEETAGMVDDVNVGGIGTGTGCCVLALRQRPGQGQE